jgi:hypothetical protein
MAGGIEIFQNIPQTQVNAGGTDAPAPGTSQSWTVASSGSFPAASSGGSPPTQFHVSDPALASEIIQVLNVSGLTWTVIRGAEGTTPVAHAAGFTIKQVVTAGGLSTMATGQNLWSSPSPALGETFPRVQGSGSQALTSGTLAVMGITLPQYLTVSNITMAVKGTAAATVTHGWYVLLDSNLVVRAVTADQTSGTQWGSTQTAYTYAVATPYVTTYTGLFYLGINVTCGTPPAIVTCTPTAAPLAALTPILCGTLSTGYSATPPAVTTALSGFSANSNFTMYSYVS